MISFAVWGCRKKSNSGTELKIGLLRIDIFTLIDFMLSMSVIFSGNYSVFFSHFVYSHFIFANSCLFVI